jgi:hypothetical protein
VKTSQKTVFFDPICWANKSQNEEWCLLGCYAVWLL